MSSTHYHDPPGRTHRGRGYPSEILGGIGVPSGRRPVTPHPTAVRSLVCLLLVGLVALLVWGRAPLLRWALAMLPVADQGSPLLLLASLVLRLGTLPLYSCLLGLTAGGLALLLVDLFVAAVALVYQLHILQRAGSSFVRVRLAQPHSARSSGRAQEEPDLWHALQQLFPAHWFGPGPRPWLTATIHGRPETPALLGILVGGGAAGQRADWVRTLGKILRGSDPLVEVDVIADPMGSALTAGSVVGWRDLVLRNDPTSLIRQPEAAGGDMLGILAGSVQPPAGVSCAEIQIAVRPDRPGKTGAGWRQRAYQHMLQRPQTAVYAQPHMRALAHKLASPTATVSVRLVAVGRDRATVTAALNQMHAAFGQYTEHNGQHVQKFISAGSRFVPVPPPVAAGTLRAGLLAGLTVIAAGAAGVVLALLVAGTPAIRLLAGLLPWLFCLAVLRWQAGRGGHTAAIRLERLLRRIPRPEPPATLLLPFRCWWSPATLSAGELGGLWHLPPLSLGTLIQWLPCRHYAPPAHAFIEPGEAERIVVGHALRGDGTLTPVGPALRDLRKVLHLTAGMGAGKSRLLANMARQFIPDGFFLLDGKGDDRAGSLAATVLHQIPLEAESRVILLDILDAEWPIGLNPLAGIELDQPGGATRALGMIMALFGRLDPETWRGAPGMQQYVQMATLLVLEGMPHPTLAGIKQALMDHAFRAALLEQCTNIEVRQFWEITFPKTGDQQKSSLDALLRRFDNLMTDETLRYLLNQPAPTIDLGAAMEDGSIVIFPLPHMTLGGMAECVAMLVFQAVVRAAFQRPGTDQTRSTVPLMIDEFQVFAGNGDSSDVRAAMTQLRSLGIGGIYAHQSLVQLGELRDEMLINSGSRIILRTSEPDASLYARQFPAADLTAADIAGQDPDQHQYAQILCRDRSAGPFSMRPLPWPAAVSRDVPPYAGPAWQTVLPAPPKLVNWLDESRNSYDYNNCEVLNGVPPDHIDPDRTLDQAICDLIYHPGDVSFVADQLAHMPDPLWQLLLTRWEVIRTHQRNYILTHPGCIPDGQERLRWVAGRLRAGTPLVLAAAAYRRQRQRVVPPGAPG